MLLHGRKMCPSSPQFRTLASRTHETTHYSPPGLLRPPRYLVPPSLPQGCSTLCPPHITTRAYPRTSLFAPQWHSQPALLSRGAFCRSTFELAGLMLGESFWRQRMDFQSHHSIGGAGGGQGGNASVSIFGSLSVVQALGMSGWKRLRATDKVYSVLLFRSHRNKCGMPPPLSCLPVLFPRPNIPWFLFIRSSPFTLEYSPVS